MRNETWKINLEKIRLCKRFGKNSLIGRTKSAASEWILQFTSKRPSNVYHSFIFVTKHSNALNITENQMWNQCYSWMEFSNTDSIRFISIVK